MVELIAGISSAIEIGKKLKALNTKIKDADLNMFIADLNIELANAKNNIAILLDENTKLKAEIEKLNFKKLEVLQFKGGAYYNSNGDGPFCPNCYDGKQKTSRLVENNPDFKFVGNYICSVCSKMFKVSDK